ncbi:MAG: hypothetical protein U0996_11235 [Planctomycetaceae bacterium]
MHSLLICLPRGIKEPSPSVAGMTLTLADSFLNWLANSKDSGNPSDGSLALEGRSITPCCPATFGFAPDPRDDVQGLGIALGFREDQNQNTILDPEEDDGTSHWPSDNRDGKLQLGLSQHLTVHSAESPLDQQDVRRSP